MASASMTCNPVHVLPSTPDLIATRNSFSAISQAESNLGAAAISRSFCGSTVLSLLASNPDMRLEEGVSLRHLSWSAA